MSILFVALICWCALFGGADLADVLALLGRFCINTRDGNGVIQLVGSHVSPLKLLSILAYCIRATRHGCALLQTAGVCRGW